MQVVTWSPLSISGDRCQVYYWYIKWTIKKPSKVNPHLTPCYDLMATHIGRETWLMITVDYPHHSQVLCWLEDFAFAWILWRALRSRSVREMWFDFCILRIVQFYFTSTIVTQTWSQPLRVSKPGLRAVTVSIVNKVCYIQLLEAFQYCVTVHNFCNTVEFFLFASNKKIKITFVRVQLSLPAHWTCSPIDPMKIFILGANIQYPPG